MAFAILDVNTPERGTPISEWLLRAGNGTDGITSDEVRNLLASLAGLRVEAEVGWTVELEQRDAACEARLRAVIEAEEDRRGEPELAGKFAVSW